VAVLKRVFSPTPSSNSDYFQLSKENTERPKKKSFIIFINKRTEVKKKKKKKE
jgi:hypothetical protein